MFSQPPSDEVLPERVFYCTMDEDGWDSPSPGTVVTLIGAHDNLKKDAILIVESISLPLAIELNKLRDGFLEFAYQRYAHTIDQDIVNAFGGVCINGTYDYHRWKDDQVNLEAFGSKTRGKDVSTGYKSRYGTFTRLLYCRITPHCYVFLVHVDRSSRVTWATGPLELGDHQQQRGPAFLRASLSSARGTLILPQLYSERDYSLFESLKSVFQYDWHFHILFHDPKQVDSGFPQQSDTVTSTVSVGSGVQCGSQVDTQSFPPPNALRPATISQPLDISVSPIVSVSSNTSPHHTSMPRPQADVSPTSNISAMPQPSASGPPASCIERASYRVIPGDAMLYLIANCLCDKNIRLLDSCIQHLSFCDLRDPQAETNENLHDYREALESLHLSTSQAVHAAPQVPGLVDYFDELRKHFEKLNITVYNPVRYLEITKKEAEDVQKFLMDTFQLLMSSMSVKESRLAAEQASRTTVLTYLAIIYLPMTVSTGIFGMNISEINNGTPKFWAAIVVVLGLVALTFPVYYFLMWLEKWRRMRKEKARAVARLV